MHQTLSSGSKLSSCSQYCLWIKCLWIKCLCHSYIVRQSSVYQLRWRQCCSLSHAETSYFLPPGETRYSLPPEGTSYSLPPGKTGYPLPPEGTSYSLPSEGTSYSLPPEGASYSLPPEKTLLLNKVPTSFNQNHVDQLKAHIMKLHDIPEGVLVRSGRSRVWRNPMYDPVLRLMSIYDFLCMPSLDKVTVREEPHRLETSSLGRVADSTTSPDSTTSESVAYFVLGSKFLHTPRNWSLGQTSYDILHQRQCTNSDGDNAAPVPPEGTTTP
ncbi:hypothetical protein Tco_0980611 [Tanacetum coccineum]